MVPIVSVSLAPIAGDCQEGEDLSVVRGSIAFPRRQGALAGRFSLSASGSLCKMDWITVNINILMK